MVFVQRRLVCQCSKLPYAQLRRFIRQSEAARKRAPNFLFTVFPRSCEKQTDQRDAKTKTNHLRTILLFLPSSFSRGMFSRSHEGNAAEAGRSFFHTQRDNCSRKVSPAHLRSCGIRSVFRRSARKMGQMLLRSITSAQSESFGEVQFSLPICEQRDFPAVSRSIQATFPSLLNDGAWYERNGVGNWHRWS